MNEPDSLLLERGNGRYVRKDLRFEDGTATATLRAIHPSKPFFQSLSVRIFKKQGLGEETKTHSRIRIDFSDDLHRNTIRITVDCKELKYIQKYIRSFEAHDINDYTVATIADGPSSRVTFRHHICATSKVVARL